MIMTSMTGLSLIPVRWGTSRRMGTGCTTRPEISLSGAGIRMRLTAARLRLIRGVRPRARIAWRGEVAGIILRRTDAGWPSVRTAQPVTAVTVLDSVVSVQPHSEADQQRSASHESPIFKSICLTNRRIFHLVDAVGL